MNRKDFTIVILLALLIPVWMFIDRTFIAPKFLPSNNISKDVIHEPLPSKESSNLLISKIPENQLEITKSKILNEPEKRIKLRNNQLEITLSSKGGGIIGATLFNYAHKNDANSDAVQFSYTINLL